MSSVSAESPQRVLQNRENLIGSSNEKLQRKFLKKTGLSSWTQNVGVPMTLSSTRPMRPKFVVASMNPDHLSHNSLNKLESRDPKTAGPALEAADRVMTPFYSSIAQQSSVAINTSMITNAPFYSSVAPKNLSLVVDAHPTDAPDLRASLRDSLVLALAEAKAESVLKMMNANAIKASPDTQYSDCDDEAYFEGDNGIAKLLPTMLLSATNEEQKRQTKYMKLVDEIFETEHTYIGYMKTVQKRIIYPITLGCMLPDSQSKTIFGNYSDLIGVSEELLHLMNTQGITSAFSIMTPYFKMYSLYAEGFEKGAKVLSKLIKHNKAFLKWKIMQESLPECNNLSLESMLILPVQRMPRYEMLLMGLLKCMHPKSVDYEDLSIVVKQMKAVNHHINEHVKKRDKILEHVELQRQLSGGDHSSRLIAPGRELLRAGAMFKVCSDGVVRARMCFLCTDMFMYAKPKRGITVRTGYTYRKKILLRECDITHVTTEKGTIIIRIMSRSKRLLVYAENVDSTNEWYDAIKCAAAALRSRMIEQSGAPCNESTRDLDSYVDDNAVCGSTSTQSSKWRRDGNDCIKNTGTAHEDGNLDLGLTQKLKRLHPGHRPSMRQEKTGRNSRVCHIM